MTDQASGGEAGKGPLVILGGGPCGLAAAWELAREGRRPVVLEAETRVGGLCSTHAMEEREGTWRFDMGGHRFVSSDERLSQWLVSLLGDDLLTQERKSVVLHDGRCFKYPLEAKDLVANLGVGENARALAGYAVERARARVRRLGGRERAAESFEDWVIARFGHPLYDTFFGPYTEKLWGIPPAQISADWAAERISLLNLGDAALRLAGLRRTSIRTYARRYLYPRYGMGQLYEALAREVTRLGGEVRTGMRVVGVESSGNDSSLSSSSGGRRVTFVRVEGVRGAERIPVGQLLSTAALPALAGWLASSGGGPLEPQLASSVGALRFRSLVFLNLALRRTDVSENTWMYVASGGLRISRIQEPKRRSPSMAPEGRTSVMLEIPCDVGDEVWTADVHALRRRFGREMAALGFPVDDVVAADVVRVEHGYPVYHLSYDDDRRALLSYVDRFANVRTAGRQGLFRYVFMDAAMQMGIEAARQMTRGERAAGRLDAIGRAKAVLETRALTA